MQTQETLAWVSVGLNALLVLGLFIAYFQFRAAVRASRAEVLMKLIEEWRADSTYRSIRYIDQLRREWKLLEPNPAMWGKLAQQWVEERAGADRSSDDPDVRRRGEEWWMRRDASQVLSKTGYLMMQGYIRPCDLFVVIPEAPRLLMVLDPIEKAIANKFASVEVPVAKWDTPFDKMVFDSLMQEHAKWFKVHGHKHVKRLEACLTSASD